MKASLIEVARHEVIDAILVSGDMTSVASPAEFSGAVQAVNDIAAGCEIAQDAIFYTFGNHDTNWRICRLGEQSPEFRADGEYSRVGGEIAGLFVNNIRPTHPGPIPGSGVFERDSFELIVLNTGYYCSSEQKVKHGRLGSTQLAWLAEVLAKPKQAGKWRVVMLHHHPFNLPYPTPGLDISTLEEGAEVCALLGAGGVDIVIHGHRHHPFLTTELKEGWSNPITFLCAGSVAVSADHRYGGEIPNLFHVVRLEGQGPHGAATGTVKTYAYSAAAGWMPVKRAAAVPLDGKQTFGSCATAAERQAAMIACVQTALAGDPGAFVPMPTYGALPLELACMAINDLRGELHDAAAGLNCNVVGAYPEEVYLKRN